MESNIDLKVNYSEVPQKIDPKQSDNGVDIDTEESQSGSVTFESQSIDNQNTKDSDVNDSPKGDKRAPNGPRITYTKEQLIQMSKQSLARIRPKYLDNAFNNNGLWNPEKWMSSRYPSAGSTSTPNNNKYNYNKRDGNENYKRVNTDPKERVIEEENEIILSPQRGSFGTGCHVSSTVFSSNRQSANDSRNRDHYSDRNKIDEQNDGSHRSNINSRRVGSGRIVPKDKSNEWIDRSYDRGYDHRDNRDRDSRDGRDNRNDDYNDRRSGRYDRRPIREMNSSRNNRYESQRYQRYREEEENEPEWFTEGPTSKHDTIELKGFDDDSDTVKDDDNKQKDNRNEEKESSDEYKPKSETTVEKDMKSEDNFDYNAMFKTEDWFAKEYQTPENKMISNVAGISDNSDNQTDSRFKRWFNDSQSHVSNTIPSDSNEFSQRNDNTINNQKESRASHPMARPINTHLSHQSTPDKKIFDLFSKVSNQSSIDQMNNQRLDLTKAMSLAQIEGDLQQLNLQNGGEGQQQHTTDDKKAFEKLFRLNRNPVPNTNYLQRNQAINDTHVLTTADNNIVIPKTLFQNRPSLLEMLKEQENKEAMADLQLKNSAISQMQNRINGIDYMSVPQNPVNSHIFGNQSIPFNNVVHPREVHNWQNSPQMPRNVRPAHTPSNQEAMENTTLLLQKAILNRNMDPSVRQSNNETHRTNTPNRSVTNANFFTPTSVMRQTVHSDKDKDIVKAVPLFNDMTSESISSQNISKPSPMRPIVKSNNPIVLQSVAAKQSPLSPNSMVFHNSESPVNSLLANHSNLFLQQQIIQQNSSQINSYQTPQRNTNPSNPNIRSFNLGQNTMTRTSTPSPIQTSNNTNQHILQVLNNTNVRPNVNQMQINHLMSLQHNSGSDGRQSQYSQSRPITATNVQQMSSHLNNSNRNSFNSFDRNVMPESDSIRMVVQNATYSQPRPQMQQMFSSGVSQQHIRNSESRFMNLFDKEVLHQSLPELPTVPLQNALTLDDIEGS